jgi:alkylation response protein AidB-like acyl-CoA dehydrogenase
MSTFPSLLHGEHEQELRASVRRLLSDRAEWRSVLARTESDAPQDLETWQRLATQTGIAALPVPEEFGGAGASWRETATVAEELGRSIAPVPFLGSAVLATAALLSAGETELLAQLASGERTATLAVPLSTWPGSDRAWSVSATGGALTGIVTSVVDAREADVLLVPADGPDGPSLWVVEQFDVTPRTSLDMTRPLGDVTLSGVTGRQVASGDAARRAVDDALTVGAAILASEQLGLAEQCLDTTVAYVKTRFQFGRPIGSYQGIKHRLAELYVEVTRARAVARYAAACVANDDPDTAVAVAVAASLCSDVAVLAAEECVQMHGGIGFTWEHPAHLWLKRAKADQIALGTPDRHQGALAELVELPLA